jgi:hypothetical protein
MSERFVLAVVADLGGQRAARTGRLRRVTRETIATLPGALGVQVTLPDGERLDLRSLDDFHPDALAPRLRDAPPSGSPPSAPAPPRVPGPPDLPPPRDGASLLESILRTSEGAPPVDPGVSELARRVSAPHLVRPSTVPDSGLAAAVRSVLSDARVHALEGAWRGLQALVAAADDAAGVEIWILDAGPSEAPAMLADELATPGAPPVAAVLAAFRYGPEDASLAALAGLAAVAQTASLPLVADVDPRVLGIPDARALGGTDAAPRIGMIDHWRRFRRHALAAHVLLCLPRVLARLPYGPGGEPVSAFPFDEAVGEHERFCWSSAALAFGVVLATAFAAEGWNLHVERHAELGGLPVYVATDASGAPAALPCAEVVMSTTTIRALVDQGCTVLASVRDQDRASFWGIGMLDGSAFPPLG